MRGCQTKKEMQKKKNCILSFYTRVNNKFWNIFLHASLQHIYPGA